MTTKEAVITKQTDVMITAVSAGKNAIGYISLGSLSGAVKALEIDGAASGKIVVAGSSSVTPVMEKLREAYLAVNPNVSIEIQMSDSSAGMTAAIDGTCDIGMASRALKAGELDTLVCTQIALDGINVGYFYFCLDFFIFLY